MKNATDAQSRMINVRTTEAEGLELKRLAEQLQTTRSRLLRKIIRESIGEGPDLLPSEMKVFQDAVFQLASLGRNLNQLLKLVHSGKVSVSSQEQVLMESTREQVESLQKETLTVIDRSRDRSVGHDA